MNRDPSRLELSAEEMRAFGYRVVDLLADHFSDLANEPVGRKLDRKTLHELLGGLPGNGPADPHQLLARLQKDVFPNNLHVDHPRFFAFVPGPNNFVSAMADALASGFNVFNGTWLGGSAAAAMELEVIDWFRQWCGFPETAGGLFVSGGSVANMTGLLAARHARLQDQVDQATVYFSDQTHSSVERALRVIGFADDQLRKLPSDRDFRLPIETVSNAIAEDRARGRRPFCVIANAGTTNTGAVDPLVELADLCAREKLWLHADGAFGAAAILSERGKEALRGLDRVDSVSLDPHKWLFQSFECGCVLVRDTDLLKNAFQIMPDYLRDVHRATAEIHFCDYGIQLTRSFRALKVWLSFQTFGLDAFRRAIDRGFALAEFAEKEIQARPGWQILSQATMGTVCFRFEDDDSVQTTLVEKMMEDGYALLTSTKVHDVVALRLCTINPRTTEADITETIDRLDRFARAEI
jgi:glutamate/tyrosine decarboxylase-like PLP-dependent enzyme